MYPHGAHPSLTPSVSRPRSVMIPPSLPVPLHVTSARKVHRSADGIINIIQEISFYAEGGVKSLAGKQLKEVHSHPDNQERGRFSAQTTARVFVGQQIIRMHIQTSIHPNNDNALEIDEVFHFAENQEALVLPIAFEATLEREEGEHPAVEFDLQSLIVVALKQRILKDPGEQYKVLQAIELRANETEARPTQELSRKSTLTQPTNDTAQFRERIFAGTDVIRVDRDIIFVCNRPVLSLSERREYMPSCPMAPRRRSASLTQSVPGVSYSPAKPRSRSQSRSWAEDSDNCRTAQEDLPTAISPYSLKEDESISSFPSSNGLRTGRNVSPTPSAPRSSRSQRKKWTVNSVVAKAGAKTPERYDRARTMRSLSTARNLSLSPVMKSDHKLKTAQARSPNGEIPAVQAVPLIPNLELGPHGECQLVEGMEVLKVAAPADSLIRTCVQGRSPTRTRSTSNCSTAGEIGKKAAALDADVTQASETTEGSEIELARGDMDPDLLSTCSGNKKASDSPPFSSPRNMSETGEWAFSNRPSTPVHTARDVSPSQQRAPSSVSALNKRRGLFGYGTRPATSPMKSARLSPHSASPALRTCRGEPSPMRTAQRVVLSPVHTAVHVKRDSSQKSQRQNKSSCKRSAAKPGPNSIDRPLDYRTPSTTNMATARNLFGTVTTNESVANMATARSQRKSPSGAVKTARPLASSPYEPAHEKSATALYYSGENANEDPKTARSPAQSLKTARHSPYEKNVTTARETRSPNQSLKTARNSPYEKTARERSHASPARGLPTARENTGRSPALMTARQSPYDKSARSPALGTAVLTPYEQNVYTGRETRSPVQSLKTARNSPYEKTARERSLASPARGLPTARENTGRSPALMTARQSPYDKSARSPALCTAELSPYEQNVLTARAACSPAQSLKTARHSPYENTAREKSHASPARGLGAIVNAAMKAANELNVCTGRQHSSPTHSLKTARHSPYEKTARERSHASPARGLPTARGNTDRSPTLMTARQSPYDKSARSPALNTAVKTPYDQNIMTSLPSPVQSLKTARHSPYDKTARERSLASPARGLPTARGVDRSPVSLKTASHARSPADGVRTAAEYGRSYGRSPSAPRTTATARSHSPEGDEAGVYRQIVTARVVSPSAPRDLTSPLRPSMTARDQTSARSPLLVTGRDALNSTQSCISGGRDSDARFTARSARSPMVTSRTQSPCTRSTISNVVTAQGARSPHVDTESPNNLATAREQRSNSCALRTGRERSRGPAATSPMNLKTARERRATRTPEHNTMPDSQSRQEDSYSEQSQFTFQKTPSGYTQKPTHSSDLATAQQRTPTKTDNETLYYSARQTTPSRTLRPDDVTLTKRTPKRDFSQHALKSASISPVRTAVANNTPRKLPKLDEMPKCSLKTGCQAIHVPRIIPSGPDSDKDREDEMAPRMPEIVPLQSPERSLRTARSSGPRTPSGPVYDMRTPRTARATPSSVSSRLRSPAPSSHMMTAVSPDAASNSNNSNEDVITARRNVRSAASPRSLSTARHWTAANDQPTAAVAAKPRVIVRANQANGKIHVEVCLSFKLNTTGTIRVRGEMVPALTPRTVSVNGQQIWSDSSRH